MGYTIEDGIPESELADWLGNAATENGTFKDGRVDYTNAKIAPAVMCTVTYENKILLLKRGYGLADAEGYWSVVTGFIDEVKSVAEQATQEVSEELSVEIEANKVKVGKAYTLRNPQEKRSYIIFPCLVSLDQKPEIKLDREHTNFAWIKRSELESYDILEDLPHAIDLARSLK